MKKHMLLSLFLIAGQSYAINSVLEAGQALADLKKLVKVEQLNQILINAWNGTIEQIVQYAINNNRNIFGKGEDQNITLAAKNINNTSKNIIALYQMILQNKSFIKNNYQLRQTYERNIAQYKDQLNAYYYALDTKHITQSKRDAQDALKETVRSLLMILDSIENKLTSIATIIR